MDQAAVVEHDDVAYLLFGLSKKKSMYVQGSNLTLANSLKCELFLGIVSRNNNHLLFSASV